jgi:hypothetical protein
LNSGYDRGHNQQALQMFGHEVAHSDGAHLVAGDQLPENPVACDRTIESLIGAWARAGVERCCSCLKPLRL